jgi:hypothetical protein
VTFSFVSGGEGARDGLHDQLLGGLDLRPVEDRDQLIPAAVDEPFVERMLHGADGGFPERGGVLSSDHGLTLL